MLDIVIGSVAVIGINSGMPRPLIALRAEVARVSTSWNGVLATAPSLAILLLGSTFPSTIRRLGVFQSSYFSTALAVISTLMFPLFGNYWIWLLLKFAMGMSLGLQWVVGESWINSLSAHGGAGAAASNVNSVKRSVSRVCQNPQEKHVLIAVEP